MDTPSRTGLVLRVAGLQDSGFVWYWRNDPVTRRNSINTESVPWSSHRDWYSEQLSDPDTRIFILEHPIDGPLAQARYQKQEAEVAEVHVTVAPASRGRGLGTRLLRESAPEAFKSLAVQALRAIVKQDNASSARAFERAGYRKTGESGVGGRRCYVFRYDLVAKDPDA